MALLGLLIAPGPAPARVSPALTLKKVDFEESHTDEGPVIRVRYWIRNGSDQASGRIPVRIYFIPEIGYGGAHDLDLGLRGGPKVPAHAVRKAQTYRQLKDSALPAERVFVCLGSRTPRDTESRCREAKELFNGPNGGGPIRGPDGKPPVDPPTLGLYPYEYDFGSVPVGMTSTPHYFVVQNTSRVDRGPLGIGYAFGNGARFPISSDACTGTTLAPGAYCTFAVSFAPAIPYFIYDWLSVGYPGGTSGSNGSTVSGTGTS